MNLVHQPGSVSVMHRYEQLSVVSLDSSCQSCLAKVVQVTSRQGIPQAPVSLGIAGLLELSHPAP